MPLNLTQKPQHNIRGKQSKRPEITSNQARQNALRLLREHRLSSMAEQTLEALATGGVLTSGQIHRISGARPRSLQRYHRRYLLDRLPIMADELMSLGLADNPADARLYVLGPVGLEIAQMRHAHVPTGGTHFIIHDVLANEVVLRLSKMSAGRGYEAIWFSKYEATVHNERGAPALEPDSLLVVKRDGVRRYFAIEFHNEDHAGRAVKKTQRYEQVYRDGRWRDEWETDEMPLVLVVFTHKVVGKKGYQEAVSQARSMGLRCTFLGKSWDAIVKGEDMSRWFNFNAGKVVDILED